MVVELNKSPKVTLAGLILLFGSAVVAGIAIGVVTSFISNFIYLILIFPVFMGVASGFVINAVVTSQKIRSPFAVIVAGLFATVIVYGSMHVADYLKFRSDISKEIQSQVIAEYGQPATKEDVLAYIDYLLVKETGLDGFLGFILLEAKSGVSISHVGVGGGSESGINLGVFTWVYWLMEMGIIGWASIDSAYKKTKELFCEHCNAWVGYGDHIGSVHLEAINLAVELAQQRDFAGLAKMLRHDTSLPSAEFYTRTCKTCNTFPFYLTGYAVSSGNKGQTQTKLIVAQVLNSSERRALKSELGMPDCFGEIRRDT